MAPKVWRKTSEDHFLEVTPQKRTVKVARQLFGQVWENLGKNPLHPQNYACSYTYEFVRADLAVKRFVTSGLYERGMCAGQRFRGLFKRNYWSTICGNFHQ